MKTRNTILYVLAGALALIVTACASVKVQSWTDPDSIGRAMGKTLVVGVSDSQALRRDYEEQFASDLGAAGLNALTSFSLAPSEEQISEEAFKALLIDQNVDSVIVTRVVGKQDRLRYHPPIDYPRSYRRHYGYYTWSYSQAYAPGYMEDYVETHLETNLYDARTAKLVWSGQKMVTSQSSTKKNIRDVIKAVVQDLQKQGMVK